jgi:protein O-GlcNAc transferase
MKKVSKKSSTHMGKAPSSQEMDAVIGFYNYGLFAEAATHAQAMTEQFPHHGFGWNVLGAVLKQMGRPDEALIPMQKSAALAPANPEAQYNLGLVLHELGQLNEAVASYKRALQLKPDFAVARNNLGNTFKDLGRLEEAENCYRLALRSKPDYAEAHNNLGLLLLAMGRLDDAENCYRQALKRFPDNADWQNNLANILWDKGMHSDAEAQFRLVLQHTPDYAEAHYNLGLLLCEMGRLSEAEASYRQALQIKPDYAEAYNNLGNTLKDMGRFVEAEASYRQVLQLKPENAETYNNLGTIFNELAKLDEAEAHYQRALMLKPDYAEAHNNFGNTLKDMGRVNEAVASYHRALQLKENYTDALSNLLLTLTYSSGVASSDILEEARRYSQMADRKVKERYSSWECTQQPERLRVGLVSGDLRNHPVGHFLENLLSNIDPNSIELIAYPTAANADELTARIRPYFSTWKPLLGHNDAAAAHMIHTDGVHVLLDLAGHTAHNRLPVFSWKPAPVQVAWLGYLGTTGVQQMDYVIADQWTAPNTEEMNFSEKILRLPESYLCFTPPDVDVQIAPLPALTNGYITFGSFNNLLKMNDDVVALWSQILLATPSSRLYLKTKQLQEHSIQQSVIARFTEHGIDANRLILEGQVAGRQAHFASYQKMDIALDPFPYPGVTTSVEGLWMGVPMLTLNGDRFVSRQGVSLLQNAGLSDWIANNSSDYVAKAVAHAADFGRLATLRSKLRQQVMDSPIFDGTRFARNFEKALWGVWQQWCTTTRNEKD